MNFATLYSWTALFVSLTFICWFVNQNFMPPNYPVRVTLDSNKDRRNGVLESGKFNVSLAAFKAQLKGPGRTSGPHSEECSTDGLTHLCLKE